jgi:hypothetical protein
LFADDDFLDGGGIRGISELVILDEIMKRVEKIQNLPSPALPCDYFDLICGTSTGGYVLHFPFHIHQERLLRKEGRLTGLKG